MLHLPQRPELCTAALRPRLPRFVSVAFGCADASSLVLSVQAAKFLKGRGTCLSSNQARGVQVQVVWGGRAAAVKPSGVRHAAWRCASAQGWRTAAHRCVLPVA